MPQQYLEINQISFSPIDFMHLWQRSHIKHGGDIVETSKKLGNSPVDLNVICLRLVIGKSAFDKKAVIADSMLANPDRHRSAVTVGKTCPGHGKSNLCRIGTVAAIVDFGAGAIP